MRSTGLLPPSGVSTFSDNPVILSSAPLSSQALVGICSLEVLSLGLSSVMCSAHDEVSLLDTSVKRIAGITPWNMIPLLQAQFISYLKDWHYP